MHQEQDLGVGIGGHQEPGEHRGQELEYTLAGSLTLEHTVTRTLCRDLVCCTQQYDAVWRWHQRLTCH